MMAYEHGADLREVTEMQQNNQDSSRPLSAPAIAGEIGLRAHRLGRCDAPLVEKTGPALRVYRDPAEADERIRDLAGEGAGPVDFASVVAERDARFAPRDCGARFEEPSEDATALGGFARRVDPATHPGLIGREWEVEALIRAVGRLLRPWAWVTGPCGSGRRSLLPRLADALGGVTAIDYLPTDLAGADVWALEADAPLLDPVAVSAWLTDRARDGAVVGAFFRADDARPVRQFMSLVPAHALDRLRLLVVSSEAARRHGDGDESWRGPFASVSLAIPPTQEELGAMLAAQAPLFESRQAVSVDPSVIATCADLAARARAHIGSALALLYGASVATALAGRQSVSACDVLVAATEGGEQLTAAAHALQGRLLATAFGEL
jgi:hypothetical protein